MATEIQYTNHLGEAITNEQRSLVKEFVKLTKIDGELKTVERSAKNRNGESWIFVSYFLDPSENKNEILTQFSGTQPQTVCEIYLNKQSLNGFDIWDIEGYSINKELKLIGKIVFDQKGRTLFNCQFDLNSGSLIDGAIKAYFENAYANEHEDTLLLFFYDQNGKLRKIIDANGRLGYYNALTPEKFFDDTWLSQETFPWNQHPYYHSATPYLPTSTTL